MSETDISLLPLSLEILGEQANHFAFQHTFARYQQRKDPHTLDRHRSDLTLFALYLVQAGGGCSAELLFTDPFSWQGMTHGLLEGFVEWMLQEGYAIRSINMRLSTVKIYAGLAAQAGALAKETYALISLVKGYGRTDGENVDSKREQTRKGAKKASPVPLNPQQIRALKSQPDTPQGRRDTFLMCLLLDHGLRCGEVADLTPASLQLFQGLLIFHREKVKMVQRHRLSADTLLAALRYGEVCQPITSLLMGSRKGKQGTLLEGSMSRRAITKRVNILGERIGIEGLSAHDCRHAWVESAIRGKTDLKALQVAGGWSSPTMPLQYAGQAEIANEGVILG